MELREPEAIGMFDHDQRRIGHVDPDLDHRRRDEHAELPGRERAHHRVLLGGLHLAVDQPDTVAEARTQRLGARLGGGHVALLAFLDQRADPVRLPLVGQMPAECIDDIGEAVLGNDARLDRLPARGHLVELADIHLAIIGERQRARDRRCGHRQQMRCGLGLGLEHHPLRDAEAMLLVDHDEPEILIGDRLLKDRVRADQDVDRPCGEPHQRRLAHLALVAPGEHRDLDRQPGERAAQRFVMLSREDLGRREQRRLRARLDRDEHRERRDERLARADIALQQAQHRLRLGEIALYFAHGTRLRAGEIIGQPQRIAQLARPRERPSPPCPRRLAHKHQCQLVGKDFVVRQPLARHRVGGIGVDPRQRLTPGGPLLLGE